MEIKTAGTLDAVYINRINNVSLKTRESSNFWKDSLVSDSMWCGFDLNIFQINTEIFNQFIQSCCVTNMFIVAKFVVTTFPCFFKHWTWLYQISLFSILISTQLDWRFPLVRIFNYRNRILDAVEMYSIKNFILKCIPLNN